MTKKKAYKSWEEAEREFLLHVKVAAYSVVYDGVGAYRVVFDEDLHNSVSEQLSTELVKVYESVLQTSAARVNDLYTITTSKTDQIIVVETHETGPEVFLLPVAQFLGIAVVTGIVGNMAYDALKALVGMSSEALTNVLQRWKSEPYNENKPEKKIEIFIIDGSTRTRISFPSEEGLEPWIVNYLNQKITSYKRK